MLKFALAGNPNCGKTTLFNSLTGSTAHVGNWPGVTVERKEGAYKKCAEPIALIDLPGIYSLSPYTPEEVVARNYLLEESPDCIINIVDATNLERNLYLTTQIMEISVPMIVALNMTDEVRKNGDIIDIGGLESKLGVPVVEISALKGTGLKELMDRAYATSKVKREAKTVLIGTRLNSDIVAMTKALTEDKVGNPLFHAIKLIEGDTAEKSTCKEARTLQSKFAESFNDAVFGADSECFIADKRYDFITAHCAPFIQKAPEHKGGTLSQRIDRVLTHKWAGIPIFLAILFAVFHLTFSSNFLFIGGLLPEGWVSLEGTALEGVFGEGGINSIGVVLQSLVICFTDWITGLIGGLFASSPAWIAGLIVDGICGGIGGVLSFVPQILLLLLFLSILEDTGYMARVAFILDKLLKKFGLSGRALMPMIMGFGCSIPAMANTRTLADQKERIATIRVIPFFSCGAKLPILTAIAGGIVQMFGVGNADVITFSMYVLGIATAIIAIIVMRSTTMRGESTPFIMELPTYRRPQVRSLVVLLWDKFKHFVKKAFTVILASTIIIWVVSHFSFNWKFLEDTQINDSILAGLAGLVSPLFTPLGFGAQLSEWGWVFVVGAVAGLIAKENVIATFGTLAACIVAGFEGDEGGVSAVIQMITATGITVPALLSFIAFNMTTIPCFAAVATAKYELGSKKVYKNTLLFWVATSYIVGTLIYTIGSWWWTSFIYIAIIAMAIVAIKYHNKKKDSMV